MRRPDDRSDRASRSCVDRVRERPTSMPPPPPEGGRVVVSWSGGKDSAMALHELRADPRYDVVGLLTTIAADHDRVSHHGVRESLLDEQASAVGLPVHKLRYAAPADAAGDDEAAMAAFERAMAAQLEALRRDDVHHVAFGDLFLERTRAYREQRLAEVGMRALFPLWGRDTTALLRQFSADGFRAVVTCAEPVAAVLCGAELHADLLDAAWPAGVDPCGEHGEFHTFVHQGPLFERPVPFAVGVTIVRDGRHYTDLVPVPHLCP